MSADWVPHVDRLFELKWCDSTSFPPPMPNVETAYLVGILFSQDDGDDGEGAAESGAEDAGKA